jgi:tetratricopeptide (TPR) repeat protein
MKKRILFFLALTISLAAVSQKKVLNASENALEKGELDKAWGLVQQALGNDETKSLPKTWLIKGKILNAIGKSTDPKFVALTDNPAVEAYNSYQKVLELDIKKRFGKDVDMQLIELYTIAANHAIAAYDAKNFEKAFELFKLRLTIETNPIFKNPIDTPMIFNCGLAALNAKKYDDAIEYLKKAAEYKYNAGSTYSLIKTAYMSKGDTVSGLATLQKAQELYPNDLTVLVDLVNFYLLSGQAQQALGYLAKAKEKDPNNITFYFAEGTLYEKLGHPEKSIEAYEKAIQMDTNYFDAYYNLGAFYYNRAKIMYDLANSENDNSKYQELLNKADEQLKLSVPYMEKAHKIKPSDNDVAKTINGIYLRLQMKDKQDALKTEMGW